MKKKLIFATIGVVVVSICGIVAFASNADSVYRIAISNVESMTEDEGTPIKTCYFYGSGSGTYDFLTQCEDDTIKPGEKEGFIYKCKSTMYMQEGTPSYCK